MTRARVRLAALGLVVAVVGLAAISPLRDISGDTTPGRLGALVLRCAGSFDLARVDFIRAELEQKRTYYFLHYDHAKELSSVFGPAPALVGAAALIDVGPGDTISDEALRTRERLAASLLVGITALLLFVAALAHVGLARALVTAAVTALSFAGIATLGQGLWQATTALPLLAGALATLAWRDRDARMTLETAAAGDPDARTELATTAAPAPDARTAIETAAARAPDARTDLATTAAPAPDTRTDLATTAAPAPDARTAIETAAARVPDARTQLATTAASAPDARTSGATPGSRKRYARAALATPALLAVAVMLRPTIAPLALGLGITWARGSRDRRTWIVAAALAAVAIAPLVAWNAIHLNSPLPLGQLQSNQRMTSSVFSLGGAGVGIAGLLVSPARGLLWFAPIAIVGVFVGLRDPRWRPVAAGVVLQLVAMALFFKWHGGQAFGPRLLAEATWIATFLAFAVPAWTSRRGRTAVAAAAAVTCIVGQLGLWLWHPTQWETRRLPDSHPSALWDIADSPLTSVTRTATAAPSDMPPRSHFVCGSTITTD